MLVLNGDILADILTIMHTMLSSWAGLVWWKRTFEELTVSWAYKCFNGKHNCHNVAAKWDDTVCEGGSEH